MSIRVKGLVTTALRWATSSSDHSSCAANLTVVISRLTTAFIITSCDLSGESVSTPNVGGLVINGVQTAASMYGGGRAMHDVSVAKMSGDVIEIRTTAVVVRDSFSDHTLATYMCLTIIARPRAASYRRRHCVQMATTAKL